MSFKKYNEMAIEKGTYSKGTFKNNDWDYYKDGHMSFVELVKDRLGSARHKVYKTKNTYFLISEDDVYLGHIQFDRKGKTINIESSNSEINEGFYLIMFTVILSDNVDEIISGKSLSTQAIKSYENLYKKLSIFNIRVKTCNNYIDFSKEGLLNDKNNVVSISSSNIKEYFEDYYDKISDDPKNFNEHTGNSYPYKRMYEERSEDTDIFLYCNKLKED